MLKFLSWNLCLMQRSDEAPVDWREDQTEAVIRERVLSLGVDVVCFQELPGMVPYVETHDLAPANTISHSGNIATLVRKSLFKNMRSQALGRFAVLTTFEPLGLTVANVHLEPTRQGAATRLKMLRSIVQRWSNEISTPPGKSSDSKDSLLIVGDTNLRVAEQNHVMQLGLKGPKPPRPTWDSRRNGFRKFQREPQRGYAAYFTRYFHSPECRVSDVQVFDSPIESSGRTFFLSDHFSLSGVVEFPQPGPLPSDPD